MKRFSVLAGTAAATLALLLPTPAHAAPVTKSDLPSKAQIKALYGPDVTLQSFKIERAGRDSMGNTACGESPDVTLRGKQLSVSIIPTDAVMAQLYANSPSMKAYMKRAMARSGAAVVSVGRAKSPAAAKRAVQQLTRLMKKCPTMNQNGAALRATRANTAGTGPNEVGWKMRGSVTTEGMGPFPVRGQAAYYRKGRTVVSVLSMSFSTQQPKQHARLVKLVLRQGL